MKDQENSSKLPLTPAQQILQQLWEEHLRDEFVTRNTEDTLETMIDSAYVNHIPVMTGGVGKEALREFYSKRFIPQMPPDTELTPISRTIGTDQLVDEMIFKFTHTIRMDWMLPGLEPTGKRVEIPLVAIVQFREGKVAHEHIYWDQASVLVQIGLLDERGLPVAGVDTARKALNPDLPSNLLMDKVIPKKGELGMNQKDAMAYIQKHGVVLASGRGPVPRLTEVIVDGPIKGSWWAHPRSREIFSILEAVVDSKDILVCRLVDGKITFVHRRLWPALVRVASRFPQNHVCEVREEHTASGRHITREVPFPKWVPQEVKAQAKKITEEDALLALGSWTLPLIAEDLKEKPRKKK